MLLKYIKEWVSQIIQKTTNYLLKLIIKLKLDEIFGLRAWGLILYWVLPSNLALLGILDVKIGQIYGILPFFYIVIASILPIFLIFMFIRDRQKEWYLTADFLNRRSFITTFMILMLATFISGVSGLIQDKYSIGLPQSLDWNEWTAIVESFLFAVASLVISTTFFITTLTKKINLPGLPSVEFVEAVTKVRNNIKKIRDSNIWKDISNMEVNETLNLTKEVELKLTEAMGLTENCLIKESFSPIYRDVKNLTRVLEEIRDNSNPTSKKITWNIYFGSVISDNESTRRLSNIEIYNSIEQLKLLNLAS